MRAGLATALPRHVGKYELLREIASGGMAVVYLGRARGPSGFEKLVAVKCCHPQYGADRGFVEMFLEEARIASRIVHPNVCGVLDVGEHEGEHFLVMEYLRGRTLADLTARLARDKRPVEDFPLLVARMCVDACEGLHAAHELSDLDGRRIGVVHRDVSPQNLMVGFDGVVRVMDFGVAHALDKVHQTEPGIVKGKLAYVSPELLRGARADRRIDVWALGVTLWEVLAGKRLFYREHQGATVTAVLDGPIPRPESPFAPVPDALAKVVTRALTRDPEARYQTTREMADDLLAFLASAGRPVSNAKVAELVTQVFESGEEVAPAGDARSFVRASSTDLARPRREKKRAWAMEIGALAILALTLGLGLVLARGEPAPELVESVEPQSASPAPSPDVAEDELPESIQAIETPIVIEARDDAPAPRERARRRARREARAAVAAAPEPAPAEARGPGQLDVATPGGWAEVRVDGRRVSNSPTRLTLEPGAHRIELRAHGAGEWRTHQVRIQPGARQRLVVRLGG